MKHLLWTFFLFILALSSCKKEFTRLNFDEEHQNLPSKERLIAVNREVASILREVYRNPQAVFEVNAAIKSEHYDDERVLLRDLIFPEISPLYETEAYKQFGAPVGVFKQGFFTELGKGKYPVMKGLLKRSLSNFQSQLTRETAYSDSLYADAEQEVFKSPSGVCIYYPYSENFPANLNPANSNINTSNETSVTLVAGDREADTAIGYRPYWYYVYGANGEPIPQTILIQAQVTDDYAEYYPTHITTSGATLRVMDPPPPPTPSQLIFIGDVLCNKQFDKLISVKNGGGSDLRFIRGDAYLNVVNGQVTNTANTVSANLKRKDVRKERWKTINMIWDANWESDNNEQVFAIYEEDSEDDKTLAGSLQTTSTYPASGGSPSYTAVGTQNYSITVKSKDDIIRQLSWDRIGFFGYNRGNLNNGCGSRNGWTIYDCSNYVRYTMPQQ